MFNYIATGISSQQPISHTQRVASYSFKQLTLIKRFVNRTWFCYLLFEVVYQKIRNRCGLDFVWVTVHYKDLNWNYVSFWNWMTHICFLIEKFSTTTLMTVSFAYFFFLYLYNWIPWSDCICGLKSSYISWCQQWYVCS